MKVILKVHLCRDPRLFLTQRGKKLSVSDLPLHYPCPSCVCWCSWTTCSSHVHSWCWCGEGIWEKGPNVWPASCRRHSSNAVWVLFCLAFSPSLFPSFSFTLLCSWVWLRKLWEWSHNRQDVGGQPAQFFSNFNGHVSLSDAFSKTDSDSESLEQGLRFCICESFQVIPHCCLWTSL